MNDNSNNRLIIRRIGNCSRNPSYLVSFDEMNVLFDCALDFTPLLHFMPQHPLLEKDASSIKATVEPKTTAHENIFKISDRSFLNAEFEVAVPIEFDTILWDCIDVILISNYETMLALPYITQHTEFRGKIFATEPTINFGRILMEDMLDNLSVLPFLPKKKVDAQMDRHGLYPLMMVNSFHNWRPLYSKVDVHECIVKIQRIAYNQPENLYGLLTVECFSSGLAIGSCNWTLKTSSEKITYFSATSLLYSHCKSFEFEHLKESDIYLVGSLQVSNTNRDVQTSVNEFCDKAGQTLREGGNVLVPCRVSGIIFDLIEALRGSVLKDDLSRVPIYVMSPQGKAALVFATSYGEWLNSMKLAELYSANSPFSFESLMQSGLLLPTTDVTSVECNEKFRSPCIVFASHQSIRFGPVVYLMRWWASDPKNTLLLIHEQGTYGVPINYSALGASYSTNSTNSPMDFEQLLGPYQPMAMRVFHCSIDPSMTLPHLLECIQQYPPKQALILPEECLDAVNNSSDQLASGVTRHCLTPGVPLALTFRRSLSNVNVHPELAGSFTPFPVEATRPSVFMGLAELQCRNGNFEIIPPKGYNHAMEKPVLTGSVDPQKFLSELKARGLDAKLDNKVAMDQLIIYFTNTDTLVRLEKTSTHIICNCEETRTKVRDALLSSFRCN